MTEEALLTLSRWQREADQLAPQLVETCPDCEGHGEYTVNDPVTFRDDPFRVIEIKCERCNGAGLLPVDGPGKSDLRGIAEALRLAGNTLFSVGVGLDLRPEGPTEHEVRSARSAMTNADRLLREIEERKG